ncbi:MAG: sugar transferase [Bdellovibrionales bacterium]
MKRVLDFVSAAAGLLLLSPLFAVIALLIKLSDRGPVFYGQIRIGQGGRPFRMWKFRSMRPRADREGPAITVGGDSRITPIGRLLRRTKMDELPQLWNVLKGEMSLVGPRPEVETYVRLYTDGQREVLRLRPGITDPASFAFFDESELLASVPDPEAYYMRVLVPEKIRINLEYAARRSLFSDLLLIFATVAKPLGIHIDIFSSLQLRPPKLEEVARS